MASQSNIYQDLVTRTGGDIYIGVVGPVRVGKSTFIKKFMEEIVLPQIESPAEKNRANDEMPQSASGKTVMTTEPKFIPDEAVKVTMKDGLGFMVKLIDCVGYLVPGAAGASDENGQRMVNTPWSENALPFEEAAELGTKKVIREHSTIGIVITTDGSFGEIPRENYIDAEKKVVEEMKEAKKPFVIVLNTQIPNDESTLNLARELEEKYKVPVIPENCFNLGENEAKEILEKIILEFPLREIRVKIPSWIIKLPSGHRTREGIIDSITGCLKKVQKCGELKEKLDGLIGINSIESAFISDSDLGGGKIKICVQPEEGLFYRVLGESCGMEISGEDELISLMTSLCQVNEKYEKIAAALDEVNTKGYGIVTPAIEDLTLEEPEIVKKPGGYGVKLKASAPSIHMIKAPITAEISPIVGSERQSEDMVKFLLKEFEEDPKKIWDSNMFGKSLYELVNEGLNTKLSHMPEEARMKLSETLQKIINEGSGGLICIIL